MSLVSFCLFGQLTVSEILVIKYSNGRHFENIPGNFFIFGTRVKRNEGNMCIRSERNVLFISKVIMGFVKAVKDRLET